MVSLDKWNLCELKMKCKLEIEGNYFEDREIFSSLFLSSTYRSIIQEVFSSVSHRINNELEITDDEERFLLDILETLSTAMEI